MFEAGGDVAHLAGSEGIDGHHGRVEVAYFEHIGIDRRAHEAHLGIAGQHAFDDAHIGDDAFVDIVVRVENEGAHGDIDFA